ncbi:MAG TPA: fluoride efflux transporter CrcB [Rhodobacterales bacterium]|nr:fluoride efflux transporter CrcB [Rhodobacterales bacterium]
MLTNLLSVALGGALGASARYLTNVGVMRLFGPGLPLGTVVVNILGSFLMGVLVVVLARRGHNDLAPFLMTGLLGGFTTFSAFSLDALTLWERGQHAEAGLYIGLTVTLSLAAIGIGVYFARIVVPQ